MNSDPAAEPEFDVVVAGLGPGGCAAALAAHQRGLRTLAVEARGIEAVRSQLILVRPGARAALQQIGLGDLTESRRTTTIRQLENRLRAALIDAAAVPSEPGFDLRWHTRVDGLAPLGERIRLSLHGPSGARHTVVARHLVDATGGRLEALGRPARVQSGPTHWVIAAEYAVPPWFEGIVGVRDPATHELYLLFPTWGRRGVIAYFDTQPGRSADATLLAERYAAIGERLGLGSPREPVWAVDVFQRALARPSTDRVVPIGDSVGTVDVLLGSGASTAIEDGVEAAASIADAQREVSGLSEMRRTCELSARIFARHRAGARRGRLILAVRPLIERAWPRASLPDVGRDAAGPPPLLWPGVRLLFGRRPKPG